MRAAAFLSPAPCFSGGYCPTAGEPVTLIFTISLSGSFQGAARMLCQADQATVGPLFTPSARCSRLSNTSPARYHCCKRSGRSQRPHRADLGVQNPPTLQLASLSGAPAS